MVNRIFHFDEFFVANTFDSSCRILMLLKTENDQARSFYEAEAAKSRWSSRQLERQINSLQMYVHYYDREVRSAKDNPTIGLILCTDKNDAVIRYVLGEENQQIFASRYKLELPDEEQLATELRREIKRLAAANA